MSQNLGACGFSQSAGNLGGSEITVAPKPGQAKGGGAHAQPRQAKGVSLPECYTRVTRGDPTQELGKSEFFVFCLTAT